jgi:hypothetical protein
MSITTSSTRRTIVSLLTAMALLFALALPASAHVEQDGLVNVNVGDVTILEDVNIGVAAQVAAAICGVRVGPVAVLGRAVDRSGDAETVCEIKQGKVTITQN